LGDLARFADDVLVFLGGDSKEVDAQGLEVAVRDGSLAIQTTPLMAAPRLFADLRVLLKVTTNKDLLRDDKESRLYKTAMLQIRAEYNVLTRALRAASLVEFVEYASKVDEEELARLTRRGASAWKDVDNPTAWVDELRGGKH
jgi:hypothetical protein